MKLDNLTENCPTCGGHGRVPVGEVDAQLATVRRDTLREAAAALDDFYDHDAKDPVDTVLSIQHWLRTRADEQEPQR